MKPSLYWVIPIAIVLLLIPFGSAIDLSLARYFFHDGAFTETPFTHFFYTYGVIPGQLFSASGLLALLLSTLSRAYRNWQPHALFVVLTLAIGSGVIAHAILKDHWGRPRPKQVIEFGGSQPFRPFYSPNFFNQPEPSRSFPCGHCTMGFYFFALALLGKRLKKQWIATSGVIITILLSAALGYTRIAQGGHFFSDVIIAGVVMWLTAIALDWLIYERN